MPTYEYVCDACGNEFENFASMSAPPIKKCPKCKKNKVQRKISVGGGIIFKGGGFYETDYRSDAYKKSADADKPASDKPLDSEKAASEKPLTEKQGSDNAAKDKPAEPTKTETKSETPAEPKAAPTESKASTKTKSKKE